MVRRAVPRSARKVNHIIKLIFIGLERVRLKGRERMLHSFRREDEHLKFDIIFQAKLFTMCLYFWVSVFVFFVQSDANNYSKACYKAIGLPGFFRTK